MSDIMQVLGHFDFPNVGILFSDVMSRDVKLSSHQSTSQIQTFCAMNSQLLDHIIPTHRNNLFTKQLSKDEDD
jgi:hypothetical protein